MKKRTESRIDDGLTKGTRTALIRSLSEMLGNASSDENGIYWSASYEERLKKLDLKIALLGQSRRALVRKRTRAERELERIGEVLESIDGDADVGEFLDEWDRLQRGLDEIHLSIAQLDRDRKGLRKERKRLESWLGR